jgi:GDP/UDP-N,N'-diacetylbacillosamine 2-epimerase (hydrolysing)
MRLGVLTSSRADFGIYQALLDRIRTDIYFDLTIIAFGMHILPYYGSTIDEIQERGFPVIDTIDSLLSSDDVTSIARSYGLTVIKFADYWQTHHFDLVLCLGDRFEMSAAVQAGIPFSTRFAHIHGGETTLGAIDNIYRHQITLASQLHFVATSIYAEKVRELTGSDKNIYTVGSLSLDGIEDFELQEQKDLRELYKFPEGDFILTTFQPETADYLKNEEFAAIMKEAIAKLTPYINFVISMPNADTHGSKYRECFFYLKEKFPDRICLVESFGKKNYFSAMKYARLVLGNSSSGIIEAASFSKYVVNVGDRQRGRVTSNNIIGCEFSVSEIIDAISVGLKKGVYEGANVYVGSGAANAIISVLKSYDETF